MEGRFLRKYTHEKKHVKFPPYHPGVSFFTKTPKQEQLMLCISRCWLSLITYTSSAHSLNCSRILLLSKSIPNFTSPKTLKGIQNAVIYIFMTFSSTGTGILKYPSWFPACKHAVQSYYKCLGVMGWTAFTWETELSYKKEKKKNNTHTQKEKKGKQNKQKK